MSSIFSLNVLGLLICMSIGDSFQLPCTTLTEYHKSLLYNDERVKNTAYIRNVIPHDMSKELDPDFPPNDDEYKGDIDWDAEWKKVVTNKDQPKERPGQYKTDLEIAATKAKVAAEKKLMSVKQETRRMTNFNTLKGDWKVSGLSIWHGEITNFYNEQIFTLYICAHNFYALIICK